MSATPAALEDNPYVVFFQGNGSTHRLDNDWRKVSALLAKGTFTVSEVVHKTGVSRRVVKALLHYGRKAGEVRSVPVTRHVEAASNVTVVQRMHGYRLP
ncbi:hypothetical protein RZO50_03835 [Microbacterium sp. SSW1-59]|uniref:hypothetical protein n=1 Tax=Microbacterium xanthum TaxID=3079794 RepID=UPI002AD514BA|nr:hypothetical protein [Microbacterium sp. SSW1-59]MDZ8200628.1 hypothetical protein [Microbacterium sp. SSW1-59]